MGRRGDKGQVARKVEVQGGPKPMGGESFGFQGASRTHFGAGMVERRDFLITLFAFPHRVNFMSVNLGSWRFCPFGPQCKCTGRTMASCAPSADTLRSMDVDKVVAKGQ